MAERERSRPAWAGIVSRATAKQPNSVQHATGVHPEGKPVQLFYAIPPSTLRSLAESRIQDHIDGHQLAALVAAEESERSSLLALADWWAG